MSRAIKVSDLQDQTGKSGPHPFLYCEVCDAEFSANKGDYFMHPDDHVFEHCGERMRLVRRAVKLIDVDLPDNPLSTRGW